MLDIRNYYSIVVSNLGEVPDWLKAERILQLLLSQYVCQLNELNYEEISAKEIAKNFIHSLQEQKSVVIHYSVIHGLKCDFESYNLSGDIQLRRLTDEQIEQMIESNINLWEYNNIADNRCLVEQRFPCDTIPQHQTINTASENFDFIITALRLLKEGRVERQHTYSRLEHLGELYLGQTMGTLCNINQRYPISNTYTLSEPDLPVLKEILQAIKLGSIPTRFRTAVDRVNFAAERDRPDDRLLDLLIAMEAIFGDESGAIGYKIGMRCAIFVETNPEKQVDIINLIKEAYDRRSALVHGNKRKSKSKLTTSEIVEKLLYFIQKSIQYIIQRLLAGESVPKGEDFDKMLLGIRSN